MFTRENAEPEGSTGVFPPDCSKYPRERLDARLIKRYEQWLSLGHPEDLVEELATAIVKPRIVRETSAPSSLENTNIDEDQPTPSASSGS